MYQNQSECHLTIFSINPNDQALLFIMSMAIQPSLCVSRNTTQCKEELLLVVLRLRRVVCPSWATVSLALCAAALLYYYYYSAGVNKFGGWKVPWALSCSPYSTHYFYLKLSFVWVKSNSLATNSWLQSTVYARLTSNNSGFIIFERMAKHPKFLNSNHTSKIL